MKLQILASLIVLLLISPYISAQEPCYVFIENSGSYERLTVSSIALTMIRQFIDSNVQPAPISGFSDKSCIYQVDIVEESEGMKAFVLGKNISDYGTSNLRGEPGLEQAILRAIFKGAGEVSKRSAMCEKYGKRLESECQGVVTSQTKKTPASSETGEVSEDTSKMASYRHPSPAFTVKYPADWQVTSNSRNPRVKFFATFPNRRAPAIEVSLIDSPRRSINENTIEAFVTEMWKRRHKNAHNFKIIRAESFTFPDGTPATICRFSVNPDKNRPVTLLVSVLVAEKEKKLIMLNLWGLEASEMEDLTKAVMRSVRFD